MKIKYKGATFSELIVVLCIVLAAIELIVPFLNKFDKRDRRPEKLIYIQETINKGIEDYDNTSNGFYTWNWNGIDTYEASYEILYKYILPLFKKHSSCANPLNCVGGFFSLSSEEYVNYRQTTDYARALIGDAHVALRTTGECRGNIANSLCALFVIDLDNKDGLNQLGQDVFMYGFWGNKTFKPFGYYYSSEEIEKGCKDDSYGDTCAAKLINNAKTKAEARK